MFFLMYQSWIFSVNSVTSFATKVISSNSTVTNGERNKPEMHGQILAKWLPAEHQKNVWNLAYQYVNIKLIRHKYIL